MKSSHTASSGGAQSDTIRYIRRSDSASRNNQDSSRPAPPPYIGQAIPRVKPIRIAQNPAENNRPASRRFDTFGENALETIYDQFKFLDETEEPSSSSSTTQQTQNSTRPIMAIPIKKSSPDPLSKVTILYCFLPGLEILAALVILISAFLLDKPEIRKKTSEKEEGSLAAEAIQNLALQNSISTVVPAILQIISAIFGFWPVFSMAKRRAAQVLHILLNSFVIVLWFNSIYDLFFKISMEHLLKPNLTVDSDEKYVIDLIIGSITYFATVLLPAITISISAVNLSSPYIRTFHKSMSPITISIGTLLFALATTVIAIFTAQSNLNGPKDVVDNSSLYAYGLKESIVFIFVIITSVFSLIVSSQNNKPMMFAAIIGQGICVLAITSELFTSERVSAVVTELKLFSESGSTIEIGIILLNGCSIASCFLLLLQLTIFTFSFSTCTQYPMILGSTHSLLDNNRNPHVERTAF